ncbi:neutral cholesterol ester hydrolase 1a [Periophthalmus magnuspinnatus]|uniref:neutral cholesterol ester hydrolase 1a n=1 Tax=Periophthalmus magnuspinnatus TaxID=409849 RepID=UPI00145B898A|nr:neutral cholesterol ester hydrolase 1a [Periophthalmus magnuspinnatus]
MRRAPLFITVLLTVALAYYVYTPLPEALQGKWKLMLMDAAFRTVIKFAVLKQWLGYGHYIHTIREIAESMEVEVGPDFLPGVKMTEETFGGVPVRVYEASGREGRLRRGLVYFHGGGWALGSAKSATYDKLSRVLSHELDAVVVSVEYSLFPEVQFPVPYLDCLAASKHFLSAEVLSKYSVDPGRVGVSGDSAGGNLAAAVSQEIAQDPNMSIKFSVQALIYPALQALDFNTPSDIQNHDGPILSRDSLVIFWMQYLGIDLSLLEKIKLNQHMSLQQTLLTPELRARFDWRKLLSPKERQNYRPMVPEKGLDGITKKVPALLDVRASPLLADSEVLSKCPKAYVVTCEFDVLRDDGLMYVRRLRDAGVEVTSVLYEIGFHGCVGFMVEMELVKRAQTDYVNWLRENL